MARSEPQRSQRPQKGQAVHPKNLKRKREEEGLEALDSRILNINPAEDQFETFKDLPLSKPTADGLEKSHYRKLTDIQARAIPYAFKGRDILGAAKTGSGKTLAFLIPVLEILYRKKWTDMDGLGALILSPTRELAIQIFEVLRKIGRFHTFSAGLVIGGKDLREERERLGRMNILVCTPGRMLQHMDQTSEFDTDHLQLLVLDEADRIMDMGFQASVDAIMEHLPKKRQTLLFSATQTKKVSDLARLSLKDPEYVSVHESANSATPASLQQNYIISPLPDKLDTLWSFIRSNVKAKILVFLSSGKQVRFVYEAFRHMQPGVPLMHIHGRQKQFARLQTVKNFSSSKTSCLFSTDVAARGLDIPAVDWVVQLDCPEDADTYIHRVGRTARYERTGRAVLFLDPSEENGMIQRLEQRKVSLEKINVRQKKQQSIKSQLQNMCFKDPELKYLGQKAFMSYVRSIHLQKDKEIFKLTELSLEEFAASLGLPGAPKIKFLKGDKAKTLKNLPHAAETSSEDEMDASSDEEKSKPKKAGPRTKYDRMFERRNQDILADHYTKLVHQDPANTNGQTLDADEDEDFLNVRRRITNGSSTASSSNSRRESEEPNEHDPDKLNTNVKILTGIGKDPIIIDSKRKQKLLQSKKKLLKLMDKGHKLVFDDDGQAHEAYELEDEKQFHQRGDADGQKTRFLAAEQERLQVADVADKELAKAKRKEKREKRKAREMAAAAEEAEAGAGAGAGAGGRVAMLAPRDDDADDDGDEDLDQLDLFARDDDQSELEPEAGSESEAQAEHKPEPRKKKKWFQDSSADEEDEPQTKKQKQRVKQKSSSRGRKGEVMMPAEEPETLEDLEAVAAGLLG